MKLPNCKIKLEFNVKPSKTITVTGRLKVHKKSNRHWKIGNTKFFLTLGNTWVIRNLKKFRASKILVSAWIREDGVLLSIKPIQYVNRGSYWSDTRNS